MEEIELTGMDSTTYLDKHRVIYVNAIEHPLASLVLENLYRLADANETDPIFLIIKSYGGNALESFAVRDSIRLFKMRYPNTEVVGLASGYVMSAGVVVLSACDTREAFRGTTFMLHGVELHNDIDTSDISDIEASHSLVHIVTEEAQNSIVVNDDHVENLSRALMTSIPTYLTASEARQWGLISNVV